MTVSKFFASLALALALFVGAFSPTPALAGWITPPAITLTTPGTLSGVYLGGVSAWTHDFKVNSQTVLDDSTEVPGDTWSIHVPAGNLKLSIIDHSTWVERTIGGLGGDHFLWKFQSLGGGAWSAKILYEDLPDYMLPLMTLFPKSEGVEPDFNDMKKFIEFDPDCASEVPEPASTVLVGVGLIGLGVARRRRQVFSQVGGLRPSKWLGQKLE